MKTIITDPQRHCASSPEFLCRVRNFLSMMVSCADMAGISLHNPDPDSLARAAAILRGGGLVAFPTETVYGLGANALSADAVRRIFAAKGRPATNPVIVHAESVEAARALAAQWNDTAQRLAAEFWPGPLTLVVPRVPDVPDVVTAGGATVALRVPDHPIALALIRATGLPLAAPSANPSNAVSPTTAAHVAEGLGDRVDMILDGGPCIGGIESAVVVPDSERLVLLRPGSIPIQELERVAGVPVVMGRANVLAALPSPGMLPRHYAPRTRLLLDSAGDGALARALAVSGSRVAWMPRGEAEAIPGVALAPLPADPAGFAARLYSTLHHLDRLDLDVIVCELPPETEEWRAVRDRLAKAASS